MKKREEERGSDGFRGGDALNEWFVHTHYNRYGSALGKLFAEEGGSAALGL